MTFRARLTLFFLGIVALPLVVGVLVADHLSDTQALRDADARLQVASLAASDALRQERLEVTLAVSPDVAVRAFRAPTGGALDAVRRSARLDYLVVVRGGRVARASIDLPASVPADAGSIDRGALRLVAAERRVVIRRVAGSSVLGGRLWDPRLPSALGVRTVFVIGGRPVGGGSDAISPSSRPTWAGDDRLVCVCEGGGRATGLALVTPATAPGLARWLGWPRIAIVVLGLAVLAGLCYALAWLLSRPLRRLADEVTALARGGTIPAEVVDPADREVYQVARTLRAVSAELSGSRGELERTRGRLAATERMTLTDPLTGVWNRRYLERALREQIKRHARFESPFALLLIDIDRFKRVNDAHGHGIGDAALVGVARAIDGSIRSDIDVLARLGGDEFVAVLPESDAAGAFVAAEKIRKVVARSPFDSESVRIPLTVSIGVAACPQDGLEPERLIAAADAAAYRAKAEGRNRTASASPPSSTEPRHA